MTMKVGFIGLGIMGKPMSKTSRQVTLGGSDRNPEAIAEVIAAETAASAKAIAEQCDDHHHAAELPHVKEVGWAKAALLKARSRAPC